MPNNVLRMNCKRGLVYIPQGPIGNLIEGRDVSPGLGVREDCCRCVCECDLDCLVGTTWKDYFNDEPSASAPTSEYYNVTGSWRFHEFEGIEFWNPGEGEFWFQPFDSEPTGEFVLTLEGFFPDVIDPTSTFLMGLKFSFLSGTDSVSGFFRAEKLPDIAPRIQLSVSADEELVRITSWPGFPYYKLRIRFSTEGGLTVCAKEAEEIIASESIALSAGGGTLTSREAAVYANMDEFSKVLTSTFFSFCPSGEGCPSGVGWTDSFDRFVLYDIVVEERLGLPWVGDNLYLKHLDGGGITSVITDYTSQVYVYDEKVQEGEVPGYISVCSKIKLSYSTSIPHPTMMKLDHWYSNANVSASIQTHYEGGWRLIGGNVSIEYTPTGNELLEFRTFFYGSEIVCEVLIDDEVVIPATPVTGTGGLGTRAGISLRQSVDEGVIIESFTTSIIPKSYYEPVEWDGSCDMLTHNDQFEGAGDIGAPYTVVKPGEWVENGGKAVWTSVGDRGGSLEIRENFTGPDFSVYLTSYFGTGVYPLSDPEQYQLLCRAGQSMAAQALTSFPAPDVPQVTITDISAGNHPGYRITEEGVVPELPVSIAIMASIPEYFQTFFWVNGKTVYFNNVEHITLEQAYRLCHVSAYGWLNEVRTLSYFCTNIPGGLVPPAVAMSPGTAVAKLFIKYKCDGRSYVHTMNNNGLQWCLDNVDLICSWIKRTANLKKTTFDSEEVRKELIKILEKLKQ